MLIGIVPDTCKLSADNISNFSMPVLLLNCYLKLSVSLSHGCVLVSLGLGNGVNVFGTF